MSRCILTVFGLLLIIIVPISFIKKGTTSKEELGKLLFFDPILSRNYTISCASCHKPGYAFADTSAVSRGVARKKGSRNTPSAMNVSLVSSFFWDGRAADLEEQALAPIENVSEMNLPLQEALSRLKNNKKYYRLFDEVFNSEPTAKNLAMAIAAFERTLETSDSPFDNWKFSDDSNAVTESVKRGFALFSGKGKCTSCHFGSNFTNNDFRNIGLFNANNLNDSGRSLISGKKEDVGKFKTPGLRNVAITAPYMHNGRFKTLGQVIDFYNDPGKVVPNAINRDSLLAKPLGLTAKEKKDIEAFLCALTDKRFHKVAKRK
jgi:cytochrome c peroxidase